MLLILNQYSNFIGLIGVISTLIGYFLLNINRLTASNLYYLFLNFFGSCLILISLFFHWNLSSALIESAWIFISLIGIYRVAI